jgi:putative hemolysin
VITYLSLVLGELVPKRIALTYPEKIAIRVAGPMHHLAMLGAPAVKLLSFSTDVLLRLLKVRREAEPPVTEEEIAAMIRLGTEAGVFEEAEQDLVERVFRLGDQPVSSLMTPRHRIVWLDVLAPAEVNRRKMIQNRVTRFLVCEGSLDQLHGMVSVTELWGRMLAGQPLDLRGSLRTPLFVPSELRALRLLDLFRETGVHLAIVQAEQGTIQGLVTLTDVLEQLSGEVFGLAEPRIIRREDGSWLMDGSLLMSEVWDTLGVARSVGQRPEDGHSLGGYVVTHLGRIPISGEYFEAGGYRFEVVDMDGSHVDKVLVHSISLDLPGNARKHG